MSLNHALKHTIAMNGCEFTFQKEGKEMISRGIVTSFDSAKKNGLEVSSLGAVRKSTYLLIALPHPFGGPEPGTVLRAEGKRYRVEQCGEVLEKAGIDYYWATLLLEGGTDGAETE